MHVKLLSLFFAAAVLFSAQPSDAHAHRRLRHRHHSAAKALFEYKTYMNPVEEDAAEISSMEEGEENFKVFVETQGANEDECLFHLEKTELGHGQHGNVYEIDSSTIPADNAILQGTRAAGEGKYALKVQRVDVKAIDGAVRRTMLQRELKIQGIAADVGVAPQIYSAWRCANRETGGYVYAWVMDKVEATLQDVYMILKTPDFLPIEKTIVGIFETLIGQGYVHYDNHVGNWGITKDGRLLLLDFGFADRVDPNTEEMRTMFVRRGVYTKTPEMINKAALKMEVKRIYDLYTTYSYLMKDIVQKIDADFRADPATNHFKFGSHLPYAKQRVFSDSRLAEVMDRSKWVPIPKARWSDLLG